MSIEELRDVLEIAMRNASAVERRWLLELVKRLNAPPPEPVPQPPEPVLQSP